MLNMLLFSGRYDPDGPSRFLEKARYVETFLTDAEYDLTALSYRWHLS